MTGYTVNTGSNEKFRGGWDRIFAGSSKNAKTGKKTAGKSGKRKKTGGK